MSKDFTTLPCMHFIALIHPSNVGPAYGIGRTVQEAQTNAAAGGFLRLGDWVAVEISQRAYETIISLGFDSVHLGLPPATSGCGINAK